MAVWIVRRELLPGAQRDVVLGAKGEPGERGEEHDDAGVHDVAAVSAAIARHEPHEPDRYALAVNCPTRAHALVELLQNRPGDKAGERVRDEGVPVAHA